MKYLTCLLLSGSILSNFAEAASGLQTSTLLLKNLVVTQDAGSFPQVPYQKTRNVYQSPSAEETKKRLAQEVSIQIANDIAYGLVVAHDKQQIRYGTRMYRKVQTAINLLRRGAGLNGASRRSGVPRSTLDQLMQWGQQRPGASPYHVE
ncbi:hypothetical protein [Crocosphaera chwakensis]|uniref:Uncharacterized protein n=1 Tax=Crocosphaera chwakensis CCY0110 TaxID=391612 RepID=A3INY1_9CHRO|nr:hypothetical protein [Crocosphaera chwakensis]EAZ91783.1 hypothetical protein CY0110_07479 [Crocosphaera chwakensis CCY0110]